MLPDNMSVLPRDELKRAIDSVDCSFRIIAACQTGAPRMVVFLTACGDMMQVDCQSHYIMEAEAKVIEDGTGVDFVVGAPQNQCSFVISSQWLIDNAKLIVALGKPEVMNT
jgi:hypothetical protein